jgi:hypothetical protein
MFGREISSIVNVILLAFHTYKERLKQGPYMISEMILVQTVLGIQISLSKSY